MLSQRHDYLELVTCPHMYKERTGSTQHMLFLYFNYWTVMWLRTALNDFFHSNSAFSELFTELIVCLLGPSCPPGHSTYRIESKIEYQHLSVP